MNLSTSTLQQIALDGTNYLWDSFWGIMFTANVVFFFVVLTITIGVMSLVIYYLRKIFGQK